MERLIPGRKVPPSTSSISSHNGEADLCSSIISCRRVRAVTYITHNMSTKGQQSLSALHRMADELLPGAGEVPYEQLFYLLPIVLWQWRRQRRPEERDRTGVLPDLLLT